MGSPCPCHPRFACPRHPPSATTSGHDGTRTRTGRFIRSPPAIRRHALLLYMFLTKFRAFFRKHGEIAVLCATEDHRAQSAMVADVDFANNMAAVPAGGPNSPTPGRRVTRLAEPVRSALRADRCCLLGDHPTSHHTAPRGPPRLVPHGALPHARAMATRRRQLAVRASSLRRILPRCSPKAAPQECGRE